MCINCEIQVKYIVRKIATIPIAPEATVGIVKIRITDNAGK
jgi:hypothetical protein